MKRIMRFLLRLPKAAYYAVTLSPMAAFAALGWWVGGIIAGFVCLLVAAIVLMLLAPRMFDASIEIGVENAHRKFFGDD